MTNQRSLSGKIARLPDAIRQKLNRRLLDGQTAPLILPWLNALPTVKTILAGQFAGKPITHRNLCYWRANGYQRWLQDHKPCLEIETHARAARRFVRAARGLAAGAAAIAADRIFLLLQSPDLSTDDLRKLIPSLTALLKADHSRARLKLDKYKVRQRDAHLLLMRDKHHRNVAAIALRVRHDQTAKLIEESPLYYEEKIELIGLHLFGEFWVPRPVPTQAERDGTTTGGSGRESARNETGRANTCPPSPAASSSSNENPAPSPTEMGSAGVPHATSRVSRDSAAAPSSNENAIPPTAVPSSGGQAQGELKSKPQNSKLLNEDPDTSDIPCPQITPGKSTQQLIAEIEEYDALLTARKKAASSSPPATSRVSRDAPLPSDPVAVPSSGGEGQGQGGPKPKTQPAKPPLSPYEQALLEGKSYLEAVYAQFTPSPEEIARRKRANEELRHPPVTPYLPPNVNCQQYYGPCPSPYTWQGPRPLDPWKVHTS